MTVKLDEIDIRRNCHSMIKTGEDKNVWWQRCWMKMSLDESNVWATVTLEEIIIGWWQHWMTTRFEIIWWQQDWMTVKLDEIDIGSNCHLMIKNRRRKKQLMTVMLNWMKTQFEWLWHWRKLSLYEFDIWWQQQLMTTRSEDNDIWWQQHWMTVKLDEIDIGRNCHSMIKTGEGKNIWWQRC